MKYEIKIDELTNEKIIIGLDENGNQYWIPTDPANSDYQAYLASLEKPTAKK